MCPFAFLPMQTSTAVLHTTTQMMCVFVIDTVNRLQLTSYAQLHWTTDFNLGSRGVKSVNTFHVPLIVTYTFLSNLKLLIASQSEQEWKHGTAQHTSVPKLSAVSQMRIYQKCLLCLTSIISSRSLKRWQL